MSYYRDIYLKSDDWKSLRLERLEFAKHKCELCGMSPPSLDVHHLVYRRIHNVRSSDLRALCRDCHDSVHFLMRKYKKLKKLDRSKQWSVIKRHLAKGIPAAQLSAICEWRALSQRRLKTVTRSGRLFLAQKDFSICRNVLVEMKIVKRGKLKWHECIASLSGEVKSIAEHLSNPIKFIEEYVAVTAIEPRYRAYRKPTCKLLPPLSYS